MTSAFPSDEDLVRRLPLPLAQLYRRAHNAKTALERHQAAYYLWEATLKLLASVAIIEYVEGGQPDSQHVERLKNLARPAIGHWWEFVRLLVPVLAGRGDRHFLAIQELVLSRTRDYLPRAAALDAALCETLEGRRATNPTVRITELFDRLVRYRNRELGHGAAGQRSNDFYEQMGRVFLAGISELLGRLDPLAGRRLIYIADVRRRPNGSWLIERYELMGETERRIDDMELMHIEAARLPHPNRVYLEGPAADKQADGTKPPAASSTPCIGLSLRSLTPLLVYEAEAGESLFFNTRRGQKRVDYLSYTTGRVVDIEVISEPREVLAQVLDLAPGTARTEPPDVPSVLETTIELSPTEVGLPNRYVGEFELLGILGAGSMGAVYRAWQPSLGRQVALKCLLRFGDPKAEARFGREIRALGRVEHPHLIKVFTSGSDGDSWFYAMELVEGVDLAAILEKLENMQAEAGKLDLNKWQEVVATVWRDARRNEKPLGDVKNPGVPPDRYGAENQAGGPSLSQPLAGRSYVRHIVELVQHVAGATHELHEAGILHRDIKPGNIMVTADGTQAILMDLGLARMTDQKEPRLTETRQFVGTLRYASPEQVLAVGGLDRRSDIYNLGATLWELLTLRPLYGTNEGCSTPELMRRIQYQEPRRPRMHHPGIAADLEAIVLKCLEKDPGRRYMTAQELADDLHRFLTGEPVQARLISPWERGWKWLRRRPATAALVGIIIAGIVGLGVGAWYFNSVAVGAVAVLGLLIGAWWYHGRLKAALRTLAEERMVAQRQVERLNLLLEMTCRIVNAPDLDTLLHLISETTTRLTNAERATIYFVDPERRELWSKVTLGDNVEEIRVPIGVGIAGTVAGTGETINIADVYADRRFNPEIDRRTGYKTRNLLTVPMKAHDGRILGVFQVLNKRKGAFLPEDVEILSTLAMTATAAVESAQQRAKTAEQEWPGQKLGSGAG